MLLSKETMLTGSDQLLIRSLADRVYEQLATKHDVPLEQVHGSGLCSFASRALLEKMLDVNLSGKIKTTKSGIEKRHHDYIDIDSTWIVDPTWQQFSERRDSTYPRVLICKRSELTQILTQFGMSPFRLYYWLAQDTDQIVDCLGITYRELDMFLKAQDVSLSQSL